MFSPVGTTEVLARLWEIAKLNSEQTRGSITGQVKALAMIGAIEGLIPDRRASSAEKPVPATPKFYKSAWMRKQNTDPHSEPGLPQDQQENETAVSQAEPPPEAPDPTTTPSPISNQGDSTVPHPVSFAQEHSSPYTSFVPDTRGSSLFQRNPFARRR
jgi:hypothetical protein